MSSPAGPTLEIRIFREGARTSAREVVLGGDYLRVGSHPSNDLVIEDPRISRFHLLLHRVGTRWRLTDIGSLNGTRLEGVSVREADLELPARIDLGSTMLSIRGGAAPDPKTSRDVLSFGGMQGRSDIMRRLFSTLDRVSQTLSSVLIEGETGTGKELVAAELVRRGPRADKPFVIVDCGAITPALIESTLFGHCRGAFTGADRERVGAFEEANGGTVFLDEIGELGLDVQPKLLRALESRTICRVGENRSRPVDVRIIAATNRRLEREVNHGRFREDLFFRLSVVVVRIPPLRERLEDIELIAAALLRSLGRADHPIDTKLREELRAHEWPGNVRELRNYLERTVVLGANADQPWVASDGAAPGHVLATVDIDVPLKLAKEQLVARFERQYVRMLLEWAQGNVSRAARKAGMDRINMHRILQRHGLRAARSGSDS